jgi:hypothetical protein
LTSKIPGELGDLGLEVPEDPASALGVRQLLCVGPLEQEVVRRVELRRETPLAEPKRTIAERRIVLDTIQVANARQVCVWVGIRDAL